MNGIVRCLVPVAQHVTMRWSRDHISRTMPILNIESSCIKDLALNLMAVNTAQSFLRAAWHTVPQTSLVAVCKLTVQTYRVSRSD